MEKTKIGNKIISGHPDAWGFEFRKPPPPDIIQCLEIINLDPPEYLARFISHDNFEWDLVKDNRVYMVFYGNDVNINYIFSILNFLQIRTEDLIWVNPMFDWR